MKGAIIFLLPFLVVVNCQDDAGKSPTILYPCKGNKRIQYRIPKDQNENDKEKNFYLFFKKKLAANSVINITLVLPSEQNLENPTSQYTFISEELIDGVIYKEAKNYTKWLKTVNGKTPYVTSLLINNVQQCQYPSYDIREGEANPQGVALINTLLTTKDEDQNCGRRKVTGTGLIVEGLDSKPGDWPWHAALFKFEQSVSRYICGGTLISKSFVLTAAHCVTTRGVPLVTSALTIVLGKYNLIGGDSGAQEKEIHKNVVHKEFNETTLANDIALLQLKSEAVFTDYVQPACLWREGDFSKLRNPQIYGTVVGWGIDQSTQLSLKLRQLNMPKIPDIECVNSKPLFFGTALNGRNFCAGYLNGSSACNGDSGGGFTVFIPDTPGDKSSNPPGAWHVRGVTSRAVAQRNTAVCDPNLYTLFTDVSKYITWIRENME